MVSPGRMLWAAFALTMAGSLYFFPLVLILAGLGAVPGRNDPRICIPLASDIGILACAVMLVAIPKQHRILGVLVIAFTALALALDWSILAAASSGGYWIIVAISIGLIVLGGSHAIIWKPPIDSKQHKSLAA